MCPPVKHFCTDLFQPCQIGSLRLYSEKGLDFPRRKFPLEACQIDLLYASLSIALGAFMSIASSEHPVSRGQNEEAKREPPCGPRITRHSAAIVSCLLRSVTA